jgi:hypothetical protein
MDPESKAQIFVLVCHFYGVASSATIMLACMDDAAAVALALGMEDVATTIKLAFIDDCLNSLDLEEEIKALKTNLNKFMVSKGFPIPFIVATYVYASSQGQRKHSARTNSLHPYLASEQHLCQNIVSARPRVYQEIQKQLVCTHSCRCSSSGKVQETSWSNQ